MKIYRERQEKYDKRKGLRTGKDHKKRSEEKAK